MVAAQDFHGRDIDQGITSGTDQPIHFVDCGALYRLLEGMQDVERGDDIERVAGERNGGDGCAGKAGPPELPADLKPGRREIEAECASVVPEQFEVGAGAASAIEQQRLRNASCGLAQQRRDEQTKPIEPEMVRFGERRRAQQVIHAPDCNDLARDCIDTQQLTL